MQIVPYLNFKDQCADAFRFYEQLLGGKLLAMMTFGETEAAGHTGPELRNLIMHACLQVGDGLLMGSDSPGEHYEKPQGLYVSLHPTDPAEADRIFHGLAEGGTVGMPIQETFWALRFGMVTDRFGTPWMINCSKTE